MSNEADFLYTLIDIFKSFLGLGLETGHPKNAKELKYEICCNFWLHVYVWGIFEAYTSVEAYASIMLHIAETQPINTNFCLFEKGTCHFRIIIFSFKG